MELQVLIQLESHRSLSRDVDLFALGESLRSGPGRASGQCSNGCSLAAAGNGAEQSSGECAPANILRGALVLADAFLAAAAMGDSVRSYRVLVTVDGE